MIAPDLLGHGQSGTPRGGDYSLGAHAAGVRDLLVVLGLQAATVIGHSFGGGATQFTYQFPELTERLVLVASGGLGREVSPARRAATFPGTRAHSSSPDSRLDVFPAAGHFPPATTPPASPGRPRLPRHDSTSHADVEQVRHRLRAIAGPERIGRAVDGAGATPLRLTMARTPIRAP